MSCLGPSYLPQPARAWTRFQPRCPDKLDIQALKINDDNILGANEKIPLSVKYRMPQYKKGNILQVALVAGTMGAKKTAELIPFCHPVGLNTCNFEFEKLSDQLRIICTCEVEAKTGVEMEAITGVNIAAITIYDMCKSISKGIEIREIKLLSKTGGKSDFKN